MQHLFLFIYIFLILMGAISIAIASITYTRTRNSLLVKYILYISNLTIFIFVYLFTLQYLNLNVDAANFYVLLVTVSLTLISWAFLIFTLPRFTHSLIWDEYPWERDIVFGVIALIALVLMIFTFRVNLPDKAISQERNALAYISAVLFYLTVAYSIVLKAISLRRLEGGRKNIVKSITLLDILVFPGIVIDLYIYLRQQVFIFIPITYCALCFMFTRYIIKQYFMQLSTISSELDEAEIENLMDRAGISSREKEIVLLLMKGLGNREIADKLFISLNTVKTHNRNIFQKLGVRSRFELLVKIKENNFK